MFKNLLNGGNLYDHSMSTRFFTLMISKILYKLQKIVREVTTTLVWIY